MNHLTCVVFAACMYLAGCAERHVAVPVIPEDHSITENRATIARHIGSALAAQVPEEYLATTTKALDVLYSSEAEEYSGWPGSLTKNPLRPIIKLEVDRTPSMNSLDIVTIWLLESDWLNQRSILIRWNEESDSCEKISISMD